MNKIWLIVISLGALGSLVYYFFWALVLIFGALVFNGAYLYRIRTMKVSEEEKRLGKKSRVIIAYLFLLVAQSVLVYHSSLVSAESVSVGLIQYERHKASGTGMFWIMLGIAGFAATFGLANVIKEQCPLDPPHSLRYLLALFPSLAASLMVVGFLSSFADIAIDVTRRTTLLVSFKAAAYPLLVALTCAHFAMSRLRHQNGEKATVYLFGISIYEVTKHGDLIVPPLSVSIQLLVDLFDQHPFGFSVDFGVLREELVPKQRMEFSLAESGEHRPTRLIGPVTTPPLLPPSSYKNVLTPPPNDEGDDESSEEGKGPPSPPPSPGPAFYVPPKREERNLPPIELSSEWSRRLSGEKAAVHSLGKDSENTVRTRAAAILEKLDLPKPTGKTAQVISLGKRRNDESV